MKITVKDRIRFPLFAVGPSTLQLLLFRSIVMVKPVSVSLQEIIVGLSAFFLYPPGLWAYQSGRPS